MKNLYIHKSNLLNNLKVIKSKTTAKICAVVKANAYGHGIKNICTLLKDKVDFFGVANLEEALEIRSFDLNTKILILGNCTNFTLASNHNISVSIFSLKQLNNLLNNLKKDCKINVHLKIDTGLNRLGFSTIPEFKTALKTIEKEKDKINIEGIFTHFATLRNDIKFFRKQQEKFEKYLEHLKNDKNVIKHGGGSLTSMFSNNYDMLRFGIYLYGYGFKKLKPVLTVESKIIFVKKVKKNQNVGYSKSYITKKDCTVAVLPLGYHDGVPRNFINHFFHYKNHQLKVLNVCMDMTIIELPENLNENITVTVFNNATNWAKFLETNRHDILVKFNSFRGKISIK